MLKKLFIKNYKKYQVDVPILLVSRCLFNLDLFDENRINLKKYYKNFIDNLIKKYENEGHKMYFLDGDEFFSGHKFHFTEFTVDGVHPTDFGNYLIAKHHYEAINLILKII